MLLKLLHPEVSERDCERCQKYLYDEKTGQERIDKGTGEPVLRGRGIATKCQTPAGCPMGKPENRRALSDKNQMAYYHYQECKAIGRWPDDGIVKRNAAIIRATEETADRIRQCQQIELLQHQTQLLRAVIS